MDILKNIQECFVINKTFVVARMWWLNGNWKQNTEIKNSLFNHNWLYNILMYCCMTIFLTLCVELVIYAKKWYKSDVGKLYVLKKNLLSLLYNYNGRHYQKSSVRNLDSLPQACLCSVYYQILISLLCKYC